jgi:hypothetical protein
MIKLKDLLFENIQIPNILYHATFSTYVNGIVKNGIIPGGKSFGKGNTNFEDSNRNYVYLTNSPNDAKRILQSSLLSPIKRFQDIKINILKINTRGLNLSKFSLDPATSFFQSKAFRYNGIIPSKNIIDYGD